MSSKIGRLVGVKFRGRDIDVQLNRVIREYDVNYFEVDWEFLPSEMPTDLTDAEQDEIEKQLWDWDYDNICE